MTCNPIRHLPSFIFCHINPYLTISSKLKHSSPQEYQAGSLYDFRLVIAPPTLHTHHSSSIHLDEPLFIHWPSYIRHRVCNCSESASTVERDRGSSARTRPQRCADSKEASGRGKVMGSLCRRRVRTATSCLVKSHTLALCTNSPQSWWYDSGSPHIPP